MDERNRQNQGSFERMGEQIGSAAGRAMGRGTEMAMGAMTSMLGSAMDAMGQWWSTADAARAAQSFDDTRDQTCRQHFQSTSSPMSSPSATTRSYEDVRPLYQFGHTAGHNPDYSGRSFDEIEADLERAWDEERSSSYGDWPEIRGYVGFGYTDSTKMPRDF